MPRATEGVRRSKYADEQYQRIAAKHDARSTIEIQRNPPIRAGIWTSDAGAGAETPGAESFPITVTFTFTVALT